MLTCLICHKTGIPLFSREGSTFIRCPTCSLVWVSNFQSPPLNAYHRDLDYQQPDPVFRNIFSKIYSLASEYLPQPGKVMEIGSSTGQLLEIFKSNGWSVQGIEPSESAANFAKHKNISTLISSFETAQMRPKSFDLIIANHVLEHIKNPLSAAVKINYLLKPHGICIISVPNFASLSARLFKSYWPLLLPREHPWQFAPSSLIKLAESAGFTLLSYRTDSGIFGCQNPFSELAYSSTHLKKRFMSNVINLPIDFISTLSNSGQNLTLVLQK
jgi:SAM-dependent methyltransferase